MLVFTSITKSYLPKARVLAKSLKHFHPDWTFVLLYSDDLPVGFDIYQEPFDEILTIDQLGLTNWKAWAFGHALVELCTAVKGQAAKLLSQRLGIDKIMYLDPDIKVFSSLGVIDTMLDHYDILLTPHLLDAETDVGAIQDNEISALKHGVYNLGFFAAKTSGQGLEFINWWADRLRLFCRDDIPGGLFTDQRWCDLAPAFFSHLGIVRDKGCNVATWNIAHRPLSKNGTGTFYVAETPLRFYHFTSYDNGNGLSMLNKYASNQFVAHELWDTYGKELLVEGQGNSLYGGWAYGEFENGESIPTAARKFYQSRPDMQDIYPDPYCISEVCFFNEWKLSVYHQKKTVLGLLVNAASSPSLVAQLVKRALSILRREGASGLIIRILKYSK